MLADAVIMTAHSGGRRAERGLAVTTDPFAVSTTEIKRQRASINTDTSTESTLASRFSVSTILVKESPTVATGNVAQCSSRAGAPGTLAVNAGPRARSAEDGQCGLDILMGNFSGPQRSQCVQPKKHRLIVMG